MTTVNDSNHVVQILASWIAPFQFRVSSLIQLKIICMNLMRLKNIQWRISKIFIYLANEIDNDFGCAFGTSQCTSNFQIKRQINDWNFSLAVIERKANWIFEICTESALFDSYIIPVRGTENRCIDSIPAPTPTRILFFCHWGLGSVFNFVYSFSWVNIARLINFAHDFTFDSNRMSRDAVNRICHTSHRVKTSSGSWLSRIPL